jgi:hypothetical protein
MSKASLMFISEAAATALRQHLKELGPLFLPAIVWAEDENGVGAWEVGFHERGIVPVGFIENIDGVDIVIEPHWRDGLQGKTLDIVRNYFCVR